MAKIVLLFPFILLILQDVCNASNFKEKNKELVEMRREFAKIIDEDKLSSYLSSFGSSNQAPTHGIFKRSSISQKKRKVKKVATTTQSPAKIETVEIPTPSSPKAKPLASRNNGKQNFSVSPRHIVKFELDDAKFDEEYEKLKKGRKLRIKRSADAEKETNKENFRQPKEIYKFSFLDAVVTSTAAEAEPVEMNESEKKTKREISDSISTDTKAIHVTHPMRGYRTKHVSYDEIPAKLQEIINSALKDAAHRAVAKEGDYLKFYYGDKIVKVPFSMAKSVFSQKQKEPSASVSKKPVEEPKSEPLKLLSVKNSYHPLHTTIKLKPLPTTTEKAETYVNFDAAPIVVGAPEKLEIKENEYIPYQNPVFYYSGEKNNNPSPSKNSMTSPGPVLFDDAPTTPAVPIEYSKSQYFNNFIYHPTTSIIKESIPIIEHVDESLSFDYVPSVHEKPSKPAFLPTPTSYVEYAGNHDDMQDKNYEFGYHVADYKSGNNFGHMQKHTKDETKGEYSILLPDGRVQIVKYFADDSGFHADVSYKNVH